MLIEQGRLFRHMNYNTAHEFFWLGMGTHRAGDRLVARPTLFGGVIFGLQLVNSHHC